MWSRGAKGVPCPAYGRQVTSTRLETPTHPTGAHRAHRRAPHSSAQRTPARYDPYLDGLFTYCLSVLCDHEAATEALGAVLVVAERQEGRCPEGEEERKSWLYALARWMCLRRLAEQKRGRQAHRQPAKGGARATRRTRTSTPETDPPAPSAPDAPSGPEEAAVPAPSESPAVEARRRELAQLAWPEAAGTTPEQREALELAVRHRLPRAPWPPSSASNPSSRASSWRRRPARWSGPAPPSPSSRPATAPPSPGSPATTRSCSPPPCAANSSATSTTAPAAVAPPSGPAPQDRGPAPRSAPPPRCRSSRRPAPPSRSPWRTPSAPGRAARASAGRAFRWTPRTTRPAGTGCAPGS